MYGPGYAHAVSDEPKSPEPSHQPESGVDEASDPPVGPSASVAHVQQPGEGAEPTPDTAKAEPPTGRRRRTVAVILAVVLGGLTVLCVGGLGAGYLFYRQVSEPDRSTPGVVLRQYLDVTLNERDDGRARLFTCRDAAGLEQVRQLRDDMKSKETQYGVTIRTTPESFDTHQAGTNARVGVKLRLSVSTNGTFQEQIQDWTFSLKNESGWRVCGAQRSG
jgi:hypothetical protein